MMEKKAARKPRSEAAEEGRGKSHVFPESVAIQDPEFRVQDSPPGVLRPGVLHRDEMGSGAIRIRGG